MMMSAASFFLAPQLHAGFGDKRYEGTHPFRRNRIMSGFYPGWVDEIAKTGKKDKLKKVNSDPPVWAHLRMYGKKPLRVGSQHMSEARTRGGLKGARVKRAKAILRNQGCK